MDGRSAWLLRNGAIAVALYLSMVEHVDWLMPAVVCFAWWSLATAVWTVPCGQGRPRATETAPAHTAMLFDLAVLGSMFAAHWYWTAFAYSLARGCDALTPSRAGGKS